MRDPNYASRTRKNLIMSRKTKTFNKVFSKTSKLESQSFFLKTLTIDHHNRKILTAYLTETSQ